MNDDRLDGTRTLLGRDDHDDETSELCRQCAAVALLAEVDRLNVAHTELIVKYSAVCSTVDYLTTRITELEAEQAKLDKNLYGAWDLLENYAPSAIGSMPLTIHAAIARHRARTESETK